MGMMLLVVVSIISITRTDTHMLQVFVNQKKAVDVLSKWTAQDRWKYPRIAVSMRCQDLIYQVVDQWLVDEWSFSWLMMFDKLNYYG